MNRREFISWVGVGAIASSLPVAMAACTPQTTKTQTAKPETAAGTPRSDGFEAVGSVSDLDKTGQLLNETLPAGKVLVIRDPANAQVIAVNPTCPHAGCTVAWQKDQNAFVCPCHNSKFAGDGKVLQGPAEQPLATYTTKQEGGTVLVKAS